MVLHYVSVWHSGCPTTITDPTVPSVIAFRFIPNRVVTRPVEAVWVPLVQKPFFALPYLVRLGMGWLALLAIVFGSAFGFGLQSVRDFDIATVYSKEC